MSLFSGIFNMILSYRDAKIENVKRVNGNYEVKYIDVDYKTAKKIMENAEVLNSGLKETARDGNVENGMEQVKMNVYAYNSEVYKNILNRYFDVKKGRLPKSDDEITIESIGTFKLDNKNIGDKIIINFSNGDKKAYTIVGIYVPRTYESGSVDCITMINTNNISQSSRFDMYVNLKEKKSIVDAAEKIAKENGINVNKTDKSNSKISYNEPLLRLNMESSNINLKNAIVRLIAVVVFLIVICSAAVIYNVFNISVIERIRYFGIMRSIGATPYQIRKIIVYEALIICIIAIPLGFISGYIGVYVVLKILKIKFFDINTFSLKMYPKALIGCAVMAVIAIFISIFEPARSAGRVSPIDAVKNIRDIKNEKIKRRRSGIGKLIFGFEGSLADKNIKRVPKRFYITIFSISISIILFIVFSAVFETENNYDDSSIKNLYYDSEIRMFGGNKKRYFTQEDYDKIKALNGVDKVYKISTQNVQSAIPSDKVNKNYREETKRAVRNVEGTNFTAMPNMMVMSYDDDILKLAGKHLISGRIDKNALNNMGVLLINSNRVISEVNGKSGKVVKIDFSSYKVGDKIVVPQFVLSSSRSNPVEKQMKRMIDDKKFYTFTVVGILDSDVIENINPQDAIGLAFSESAYRKLFNSNGWDSIAIKFKNKNASENLSDYFLAKAKVMNWDYVDYYKLRENQRNDLLRTKVFFYGFIVVIALIGIVNIINTILINILARKREFATLMAVGMTHGQVTKMILLEGGLYSFIASAFGIFTGAGIVMILFYIMTGTVDVKLYIPLYAIIISIAVPFIVTLLTSFASLKAVKNMNIIDNLKMD